METEQNVSTITAPASAPSGGPTSAGWRSWLRRSGAPGWRSAGGALGGIALLGLVLGVAIPRGPVTTGQSLLALALCLVGGLGAGWLMRTRWAALGAPAVFAAGYELARWGTQGPTLGAIRFDLGIWGAMAFAVGRGFDALVMLLPMAVAALWGAALARRSAVSTRTTRHWPSRVLRAAGMGLATVAVVAFAAALARPASTAAILGPDGAPAPDSIAELATIRVGGHDQVVMLRGRDVEAPVLLFLEGGPGGTAIGAMRHAGQGLEQDFVVATWDQRGTGKSIAAREPAGTLTVDQMVADTIEVTDYLRQRFAEQRIYLVGSSWGTTLGVLTAQARPDLFHAYVGAGQMVDQQETDKLMYARSLEYARQHDGSLAGKLRELGPPPYTDMLAYPLALSSNPELNDYARGADYEPRAAYPVSLFVPEYTLTEQFRSMGAIIDTFAVLYPQLQEVDFRVDVPELDVPVFLVEGAHEAPGRAVLATEWFQGLDAPQAQLVTWERSGHTPHLDEPGRFHELMLDVRDATYPGAGS